MQPYANIVGPILVECKHAPSTYLCIVNEIGLYIPPVSPTQLKVPIPAIH